MKTEIRINLKGLDNLQKQLGSSYRVRVGVLGSNASRTEGDISNPELGAVQMFGSLTKNIPPRDFLLMPLQHENEQLLKAMGTGAVREALRRGDYKKIFNIMGAKAVDIVQQAFETGGFGQWPPHAPGTKPHALLILTGQLRRAISFDVVKKSG